MVARMRDGSVASDVRLGRLPQFDPRSRAFAAAEPVATKRFRSYTWRLDRHLDQLRTSQCVSYTWHHEAMARPAVVMFGSLPEEALRRLIEERYWEMQRIDPWEGGEYPGASPQYGGTSTLAGAKVMHRAGYFARYDWAFSLSDLVLTVGYRGPVAVGTNWYEGMFYPTGSGRLEISGDVAGGHEYLLKGVSVPRRTFRVHNSWGTSWGIGGDAEIGWDDMERLLHEQGDACIPAGRLRPIHHT